MPTLSYTELDNLCDTIRTPRIGYSSLIFDFFRDCYFLGVRPAELIDVSLWSDIGSGRYQLQPLKNNLVRQFDSNELSSRLREGIFSGNQPYLFTTLRKQRYYCERFSSVGKVFNQAKEVEIYLFRYRYVKALFLQGLSNRQVTDKMGWNSLDIARLYNESILTYSTG